MLPVLTEGTTAGAAINTGLQASVQPSGITDNFVAMLPWIGAMMLVALVVWQAKKLLKGGAHAKLKLG